MKALTAADFAPGARWQRTFHVDGCRVRVRRNGGKWHVKVTDPAGDYAHELRTLARVAGLLAEAHIAGGVGLNIGHPRIIADHEPLPETSTEDTP